MPADGDGTGVGGLIASGVAHEVEQGVLKSRGNVTTAYPDHLGHVFEACFVET